MRHAPATEGATERNIAEALRTDPLTGSTADIVWGGSKFGAIAKATFATARRELPPKPLDQHAGRGRPWERAMSSRIARPPGRPRRTPTRTQTASNSAVAAGHPHQFVCIENACTQAIKGRVRTCAHIRAMSGGQVVAVERVRTRFEPIIGLCPDTFGHRVFSDNDRESGQNRPVWARLVGAGNTRPARLWRWWSSTLRPFPTAAVDRIFGNKTLRNEVKTGAIRRNRSAGTPPLSCANVK